MPDSTELLLHDILTRIGGIETRLDALHTEVVKLNDLPQRVRALELWRAGVVAVGGFVALVVSLTVGWLKR